MTGTLALRIGVGTVFAEDSVNRRPTPTAFATCGANPGVIVLRHAALLESSAQVAVGDAFAVTDDHDVPDISDFEYHYQQHKAEQQKYYAAGREIDTKSEG